MRALRRAAKRLGTDDGVTLLTCWCEANAEALQQRGHLTGDEAELLWRGQSFAA
jgi:hypothetical protein